MTNTTVRYHIRLCQYRTTISLDEIVSDLLALKLRVKPNTREAHRAVRLKLEAIMRPYCNPKQKWFYSKPTQLVTE